MCATWAETSLKVASSHARQNLDSWPLRRPVRSSRCMKSNHDHSETEYLPIACCWIYAGWDLG